MVPLPDGLHLFLKHGETVFYRWEAPGAEFAKEKRWTPVAKARLLWSATHKGNEPVLFVVGGPGKEPGEFGQEIVGLKRDGESWQPFVTVPGAMDFGALMVEPADEKGSFVLITQSFPGRVRTLLLEDGRVARDAGYGSAFPFAILMPMMGLIFAAMLVVPLVLSFVLSPLMRWYRVDHVTAGTRSAFQAPIWRRAFAELTDGLLLFGPAATGYVLMMSSFTDPDRLLRPIVILPAMGFVMGGLLWLPVCFVLFCFTEGKWGRTPGKWLTGIQVLGTDLRPCGFGRALVRNLLKVVDGFFNFMVGILVAALSENWQRLGDMAARTVVIRVDGGSGASGSTIQ